MVSNVEQIQNSGNSLLEEALLLKKSHIQKTNLMTSSSHDNQLDIFACVICGGLLRYPTTTPCGYSACKSCFNNFNDVCPKCDAHHCNSSTSTKSNVLLTSVLQKWFPEYYLNENFNAQNNLSVPIKELIDPNDFQCSLCSDLLYDPVCTGCGHVFCLNCIQRSLDYNNECPLCKEKLNMTKDLSTDIVTANAIESFLPSYFSDRKVVINEEINTIKSNYPVFLCTLTFPSVPCPLHIFEPRYCLLVRRALKYFDRTFGMCMKLETQSSEAVGTILYINDIKFLEDGRSILNTVGTRRFIPSNSKQFDGYNTSKINLIIDKPIRPDEMESVNHLLEEIYAVSEAWFKSISNDIQEKVLNYYGNFPSKTKLSDVNNGPDWHWWLLNILPLSDDMKTKLLHSDCLKHRLLEIQRILKRLELSELH